MHQSAPPTTHSHRLPPTAIRAQQIAALTRVNIEDLLGAFGLSRMQWGRRLLERLCFVPARQFARKVVEYDDVVGTDGLMAGGAWAVERFGARLEIVGQDSLPRRGPTLIVANHPGLCDTTALFAAIPRADLLIVAADRPFLRALPHTSRHLIYVDESATNRLSVIRAVARHLRNGGAVLTFPGGRIEPDPAVLPGAVAALDDWSESIDLFGRFANDLRIVPAIVSGVLSPAALRHPITRLRRKPKDREWLAALLQIQVRAMQRVTVRVVFGQAFEATQYVSAQMPVSDAVKAEARRLIEQVQPA